jgi:hypothetical protein
MTLSFIRADSVNKPKTESRGFEFFGRPSVGV